MTDDPLVQLRKQLVDAGERRAAKRFGLSAPRGRVRRRGGWLALTGLLIVVPAGATAAGIIDFGSSGSTPDGSTFTTGRISDDQASTDPAQRDGIGRTCETSEIRDPSGELIGKGLACRPKNVVDHQTLSAGFEVVPGNALLIQGSVAPQVTQVTISGYNKPVELKAGPDGDRHAFTAVVPAGDHDIVASDKDGQVLARTTLPPGHVAP